MSSRAARLCIAVCSAVAVLVVAFVDLGRKSPGAVSAVHGRVDGLAQSCSDCHGGWRTDMTEACLECHEAIQADLDASRGLHGRLADEMAQRCALCHGEHYGEDFPLVNVRSFSLAGVPKLEEFDHALVGFAMAGKHLELSCTECHANAEVQPLPEGEPRWRGLSQDCATCHDDPHEGAMAFACANCHGQEEFDVPVPASHDRFLPLVGGHAASTCRDCHAEGSTHALEALGQLRVPRPRDCAACHDSPHQSRFVEAVAELVESTPGASCVHCHRAEHVEFRADDIEVGASEHALSGFPLDAPHADVACAECHAPGEREFAARYPGRAPEQCSRCHEDVHGGQFAAGPFAGMECTACHDTQHFEPHAFTADLHARASLALEGAHLDAECRECHADPKRGEPRGFRGTSPRCESCHADAHRGFFDGLVLEPADPVHGDCASCHGATSFSELAPGGFDHARWTGFAVAGAHAQAECEACHPRAEEADQLGRRFGRVSERFGEYRDCATCHEDPHRRRFDALGLPAEVGGRTSCARCHADTSFRILPDFDHGLWTGFALDGRHAEIDCAACHAPLRKPDALGRTWAPARSTRCEDCHADPHVRQFEESGRTDCARCHQSAASFAELVFDHERDARFPLGEAHRPLACDACHKPWSEEVDVIRYRPVPRECADCHGRQDHPLRKLRGRKG